MRARTLLVSGLLKISSFLSRGSGLFTALAIGACDQEELHSRTTAYWDDLEELQTDKHTESGLMSWEQDLYERFLPTTGTVGLIGCGTGRDLFPLIERGHIVDGVDGSPTCVERMLRNLEYRKVEANIECADITSYRFPRETYDAFVFSWYLYAYLPGPSRRVAILARLRERLSPNGRIILSLPKQALVARTPSQRVSRWMARITRNPMPPGELDFYLVRNRGRGRLMWMREFTRPQLAAEAARAGFDLVCWHEYDDEDDPIGVVLAASNPTAPSAQ